MSFLHSSNFSGSVHQNSSGKMSRDLVLPFPLHPLFHLFVSLNSLGDRRMVGSWEVQETSQMWFLQMWSKEWSMLGDFPKNLQELLLRHQTSVSQPDLAPRYHLPVAQRSKGQYHLFLAEMLHMFLCGSNAKDKKCQNAYNWMVKWMSKSLLTMVKNLMLI